MTGCVSESEDHGGGEKEGSEGRGSRRGKLNCLLFSVT